MNNAGAKLFSSMLAVVFPLFASPTASQAVGTIVVWGDNYFSQTNVPPDLTNAVAGAAGFYHSLALRDDGTVTAWGRTEFGQCAVPVDLADVVAIAAGESHNLALKGDGTVVVWGSVGYPSDYGVTNIPAGLTDVARIGAGPNHNLVVKSNGVVVGWGANGNGQAIGYPTPYPWANGGPVIVNGRVLTNVLAITGGHSHSLAIANDMTVWGWGENGFGEATGTPTTGPYPHFSSGQVHVEGQILSNVIAVAAGNSYSLALKADGTVVGWGYNPGGQAIGTPTPYPANGPVVLGGQALSNVVEVHTIDFHNVALKEDGTVVAWGANDYGQTNVPAGLTNVVAVGAGSRHSFALTGDFPPRILIQPRSQTVNNGATVSFAVKAFGPRPLAYQWQRNGTSIPGANAPVHTLSSVGADQSGIYTLVVTNGFGSVTSSPAILALRVLNIRMCAALTIDGPVGSNVHIEFADTVANPDWRVLTNITLPYAPFPYVIDWDSASFPRRIYRAILPP